MTPRFVLRRAAAEDIQEATAWYALRSTSVAAEFLRAVDAALADIGRAPEQHPPVTDRIRRALLRRFPYALYFTRRGETTYVIACMHHRRHPRRWRRRA
jgi:plasmid stabilization system protein ParE